MSKVHRRVAEIVLFVWIGLGCVAPVSGATFTWTGGGANNNWTNDVNNWGGATLAEGSSPNFAYLKFGGSSRLNNTNNFVAGTGGFNVSHIDFLAGAGAFFINGKSSTFTLDMLGSGVLGGTTYSCVSNLSTSVQTLNLTLIARPDYTAGIEFNADAGDIVVSGVVTQYMVGAKLKKTGPGTLTLSKANFHSGSTTVSNGTLRLSNTNAIQNSVLVMGGGAVVFDGAVAENAFTCGGLSSSSSGAGYDIALQNDAATAITLSAGSSNTTNTYGGVLSGPGSLVKIGSGALSLTNGASSFTGTTTIKSGTLLVKNPVPSGANSALGNTTSAILLGDTSGSANTVFGPVGGTANLTISRDIVIQAGNSGVARIGHGDNSDGKIYTYSGSITLGSSGASHGVTLGTTYYQGTAAVTNIFDGTIQDPVGASGGVVTIGGAGGGYEYWTYVSLAGSNTFSGGVSLGGGTLVLAHQAALGTGPFTISAVTGRVVTTTSGAIQVNNNPLILNGTLRLANGNLNLGSGNVTLTSNRVVYVSGGATNILNTLTLGGVISDGGNGYSLTYAGGYVANAWSNALTLTGLSDFSGGFIISDIGPRGQFNLGNLGVNTTASAVGTGPFIFNPNTSSPSPVRFDNSSGADGVLATGNPIVLNTDILFVGSKSLDMGTGLVSLGSEAGISRTITVNANTLTLSGVITNGVTATGLLKAGSGRLALVGTNVFTGLMGITGGQVVVGNTLALQYATVSNLVSGGLGFAVDSATLGGLAGTNGFALTNGAVGVTLTVGGNNTDTTYGGVMSGDGNLIKTGTGILTLAMSNSFTGGTTINGGALRVCNAIGSGTGPGPVSIMAGGMLGGTGIISGAVSNTSGGMLAPGAGVGVLTVGSLVLSSGSTNIFEFNASTNDQVVVSEGSGLTVAAGAVISLINEAAADCFTNAGVYNLIRYNGSIAGDVTGLVVANAPASRTYWFDTDGTWIRLHVAVTATSLPVVSNNGGAVNITASTATLPGDLVFDGGGLTRVWLYWGPSNGESNAVTWSNQCDFGYLPVGPVSTNITGLEVAKTYYYTWSASNAVGETWSGATNFMTVSDEDGDGLPDSWEITFFGNTNRDGTADWDGDGSDDSSEFTAGTDPTNSWSVFKFLTLDSTNSQPCFTWSSLESRTYAVQRATNFSGGAFTEITSGLAGSPTSTYFEDAATPEASELRYRIVASFGAGNVTTIDTADFVRLTTSGGGAGGTVSPSAWYVTNSVVPITAATNSGYGFAGWSGDVSGLDTNSLTIWVTNNQPKAVTANFVWLPHSGMYIKVNNDGLWDDPANWVGGIIASGATCTATFGGAMTADRIVTQTSNATSLAIGHLVFTNSNATVRQWTISSSGLTRYLTFDADGLGGGTSTIYVAASAKAAMGSFAGTSAMRKTGPGQLTLSNSNKVYAGTFTVASGTLYLGEPNALKSTALVLDGGDNNVSLGLLAATDGAIFAMNGLTVTESGTGTVSLTYPSGGTRDVIASSIALGKTVSVNVGEGYVELRGGVSGNGGLVKTGAGVLYFSVSSSTYSGVTTLSQGSIRLLSNSGYTMLLSGGQFEMGDVNTGSSPLALSLGGSNVRPNLNVHVTTNGTSAGLTAGVLGQSVGSCALAGTVQIDRPLFGISCTANATSLTLSSVISGVGGIQVNNDTNRTVVLTGANTYSGGTTVVKGALKITGIGTLGSGSVTVQAQNTNAVLQLWGGSSVIDDAANVYLQTTNGFYGMISITNGVNETVHSLYLDGIPQESGTYGSTASSAIHRNDNYFDATKTGILTVLYPPVGSVFTIR